MVLTAVVFLFILSVLVLVHEFGHFIVGKIAGIGVLEFALGLPFTKPLWSRKLKNGMRISLYPVLFGGFVRLLGEEGNTNEIKDDGSEMKERKMEKGDDEKVNGKYFYKSGVWARIGVVVAGVAMNFVLAVLAFYVFLAASNFKVLVPKLTDYKFLSPTVNVIVVTDVSSGSPAQKAGLVFGDLIYSVDGQHFSVLPEFQEYVASHRGERVTLKVFDETYSRERTVELVPRLSPPKGQGSIGIGINEGAVLLFRSGFEKAISGLVYSLDMLFYSLRVLAGLVFRAFQTGNVAPVAENVSGPIGIWQIVGSIVSVGGPEAVKGLVNLLGLLSVSLAFMNILPIPAMDGGKLMFLLVEAIFGKKLAASKENLINQIGTVFLLALIILISFNDLKKVFGL